MLRKFSIPSKVGRSFTVQSGLSDCGASCLYNIIRYHGGRVSMEYLKLFCGTDSGGATLLALKEAAEKFGFTAKGLQVDNRQQLKNLPFPSILHVKNDHGNFHYIICYQHWKDKWLIGDPARGLRIITYRELQTLWHSRVLLMLEPMSELSRVQSDPKNWFHKIIEKHLGLLTVVIFLGILVGLLGLSQAVFTQQIIDRLLPNKDSYSLSLAIGGLFGLLLIRASVNYLRNLLLITHHTQFNNELIQDFLKKIFQTPIKFLTSHSSAEILARINDSQKIQKIIQLSAGSFIVDVLITVIIILGISWFSFKIGLMVCLIVTIMIAVLWGYQKVISKGHYTVMSAFARRENVLIETFDNIKEIKINNGESDYLARSMRVHQLYHDNILKLGKYNLSCGAWSEVLAALLVVIPMSFGAVLVSNSELQLGEWVALLFLVSGIAPALSRSVLFNTHIKEARAALTRLHEIQSLPLEQSLLTKSKYHPIENIIISRISFSFPGQPPLIDNLNLELIKDRLYVLTGKSGSGKSTVLDLILRIHRPKCGLITVDSHNLERWNLQEWRNRVTLVPQTVRLFQTSLAQNIAMHPNEDCTQAVSSFCRSYGFDTHLGSLSQKYHHMVAPGGVQLSGGEGQLIAWARALYRKPQVLLLDEATTFLDNGKKSFVLGLLQKIKKDTIILMVSHDPYIMSQADKVIEL